MKITFVTSNQHKVREFKTHLPDTQIEHIAMEYKEMRSDNPEEIAKDSAQSLANQLKKPVVVEDSGLFIDSGD